MLGSPMNESGFYAKEAAFMRFIFLSKGIPLDQGIHADERFETRRPCALEGFILVLVAAPPSQPPLGLPPVPHRVPRRPNTTTTKEEARSAALALVTYRAVPITLVASCYV